MLRASASAAAAAAVAAAAGSASLGATSAVWDTTSTAAHAATMATATATARVTAQTTVVEDSFLNFVPQYQPRQSPRLQDQRHRSLIEPLTPILRPILAQYALNGGAEFDNPDSYQSRALDRVAQQVGVMGMSDVTLIQYYALYCIYETSHGQPNVVTSADERFDSFTSEDFPGWFSDDGWTDLDRPPCGKAASSATALDGQRPWHGIVCEQEGETGVVVVTEFRMVDNMLTGFFPPEIKLLAGDDGPFSTGAGALQHLEVFDNEFLFNNFDNSWMTDLGSSLEHLFVGFTAFAGRLPILPVGVVEVDFSYTLIHSGLEDADVFANTPNLEFLSFGANQFNTTIPTTLTTHPTLQFLYFSDCDLRDTTLDFIVTMPVIFELWLDKNPQLTGTIPSFLGTSNTTLSSLSLTENGMTGPIPTTLGTLDKMIQLWLYDNAFTGTIPTELGNLNRLKTLEVTGNAFTLGSVLPSEVCANTGLFGSLKKVGADCDLLDCPCCTCCTLNECQPIAYPTFAPVSEVQFFSPSAGTP